MPQPLHDKLHQTRLRFRLRVPADALRTTVGAVHDQFVHLNHVVERPAEIAGVSDPPPIRLLHGHLAGTQNVIGCQKLHCRSVLQLLHVASADRQEVLPVCQIGVVLRDQQR